VKGHRHVVEEVRLLIVCYVKFRQKPYCGVVKNVNVLLAAGAHEWK